MLNSLSNAYKDSYDNLFYNLNVCYIVFKTMTIHCTFYHVM